MPSNPFDLQQPTPEPGAANKSNQFRMKNDWDNYWNTSKPNETVNTAGGTLQKQDDGSAMFRNGSEYGYRINRNDSFDQVAQNTPGWSDYWKKNYDFDFKPTKNVGQQLLAGWGEGNATLGGNPTWALRAKSPEFSGVNLSGATSQQDVFAKIAHQAYAGGQKLTGDQIAKIESEAGGTGFYLPNGDGTYRLDPQKHNPSQLGAPNPTSGNQPPADDGIRYQPGGPGGSVGSPPSGTGGGTSIGGSSTGLINGATLANATTWNVQPNQTVQYQANSIANSDSPLMQQARANALVQSNERGLINSNMAVGAGQAAVMDRAIDIGKADASTYAQSGQFNANSANQNSMFNAGQINQFSNNELDRNFKAKESDTDRNFRAGESSADRNFRAGESSADRNFRAGESSTDRNFRVGESSADRNFRAGESSADRNFRAGESQLDRAARIEASKFDATTRKEMADIERKYQTELKNDAALDSQYSMYVDSLFKIDSNRDLDAASKTALKRQQAIAFESFAKIRGLKLDLDFSSQYAAPAPAPAAKPPTEPNQPRTPEPLDFFTRM